MQMKKRFSNEFVKDMQDLIQLCFDNDVESVSIDFPFNGSILDLKIEFYAKSGKVNIKEDGQRNRG